MGAMLVRQGAGGLIYRSVALGLFELGGFTLSEQVAVGY